MRKARSSMLRDNNMQCGQRTGQQLQHTLTCKGRGANPLSLLPMQLCIYQYTSSQQQESLVSDERKADTEICYASQFAKVENVYPLGR
tara:strand:+ start:173 stop:436 length:264 start_codon:yes stop_codon:yes gene_type:complete